MSNISENGNAPEKAPWTAKRVAAVIGIVLLVGLYILTFVSALIGTGGSGRLFRFSLGMTALFWQKSQSYRLTVRGLSDIVIWYVKNT